MEYSLKDDDLVAKCVVYTCIIGNYDNLQQPKYIHKDFDYICFVRKGEKYSEYSGVWKIIELEYDTVNNIILSRYPKLNPHLVLPSKYDYSLWIDGNIIIAHQDIYSIILDKIKNNILYSGVKHWARICLYDESSAIILSGKASTWQLIPIIRFLIKNKFPRNFGLSENNVILRNHNDSKVIKLDELWWSMFIRFCKRDQMSFSYCMYKTEIEWDYLLPIGYCARNHYTFLCIKHPIKHTIRIRKFLKIVRGYIGMFIFRLLLLLMLRYNSLNTFNDKL